jgi:hypothetical protein
LLEDKHGPESNGFRAVLHSEAAYFLLKKPSTAFCHRSG